MGLILQFLVPIITRRIPWLVMVGRLIFEIAQLFFNLIGIVAGYGHAVDINDVMLNGLGTVIGYAIYRALLWLYQTTFNDADKKPLFLSDVLK